MTFTNENKNMSRRAFVSASALAAMAAGLVGCAPAQANNKEMPATGTADEAAPSASAFEIKEPTETVDCDIVVVGAGLAGFSAALSAVEGGASKVVLLEANSNVGGCSAFTEGIFGAGTSMQKEAGETGVDVQSMLNDVYAFHHYNVNTRLWELLANNSADNIDWLINMGVVFDKVASSGDANKTLHVHHEGMGMNTIAVMNDVALSKGVEIRTDSPATALLVDNGAVTGVQAETAGGDVVHVNAKSVILACGGIGDNFEYAAECSSRNMSLSSFVGIPGATGFSLKAVSDITGERPGPVTVCAIGLTVDGIGGSPLAAAFAMQPCNLWVNADAGRLVDESNILYYSTAGNIVFNQNKVFSIFDQGLLDEYTAKGLVASLGEIVPAGVPFDDLPDQMAQALDAGQAFSGQTVEELAAAMGVEAAQLSQSVERYNELCAKGADDDYAKAADYMRALATPPYYAAQLKIGYTNTCGGVNINENCEVVNSAGEVVPNLYATGVDCSGFQGETYCILLSGSEQASALCTGRIAGTHAAQRQ